MCEWRGGGGGVRQSWSPTLATPRDRRAENIDDEQVLRRKPGGGPMCQARHTFWSQSAWQKTPRNGPKGEPPKKNGASPEDCCGSRNRWWHMARRCRGSLSRRQPRGGRAAHSSSSGRRRRFQSAECGVSSVSGSDVECRRTAKLKRNAGSSLLPAWFCWFCWFQ